MKRVDCPGGAVGAAEAGRAKRRDGASTTACEGRCISNIRRTGGVTKI